MSPSTILRLLPCFAFPTLLGCKALGPNHQTPEMNLPASFSQGGVKWKRESPDSQPAPRQWWRLYNDPTLTSLVEKSLASNQEIAAASARLRQARAISRGTRSLYFPTLDISGGATRSRTRATSGNANTSSIDNRFSMPVDLSYELDLWGRIGRQVESAEAREAASAESLNALNLSIASEVAQTYWTLRAVDADRAVLDRTLELRRRAYGLLTEQRNAGAISGLDLSRSETEVASAEADRIQLDQSRSELVNALAVLTGSVATGSNIPEKTELPPPPRVPGTVPSELLRQRPDIRASERLVAAANADIGVAIASYYPSVSIGGSAGFTSRSFGNLFQADSLIWSIGPNVTLPIGDQPFLRAQRDASIAAHEAATADYRQTVLQAMSEVETALQGGSILVRRQEAQARALKAARETFDLSFKRFEAGLVSFLDVVDAERTRLENERLMNAVLAERLAVSVALIKAVGGEWR